METSIIIPKLVFTEHSPQEQYEALYNLGVGEIFKIQSDYETVMRRIEQYKPQHLAFEVFPINPGTTLYTMYGPDHCIITENRKIQST